MIRSTEYLIRDLTQNLAPVRPLSRPWIRAAIWLAVSAPYIAVLLLITPWHSIPSGWPDFRFVTEEVSALAVGLGAAVAAFATIVPGHNRRPLALLFLPLAVWLGSIGEECVQSFIRLGPQALTLQHNLFCLPFIVVLGAFPAIAMAIMLRRGAPLTPHLTTALGALAAAGLANSCSRLFHREDVTLMLVVWHVGGVFLLSAVAAAAGRSLLNWRLLVGVSQNRVR